MIKFEGRIQDLEIHNGILSALDNGGDNLIKSSAILSTVTGSVSLGAQTVFLATQSRLHIQTVVMKIGEKICVGQFHRALFEENEYVICVARKIENNVYELYSVLSPKTGLLHMQVGMGASDKTAYKSMMKGGRVWYICGVIVMIIMIVMMGDYEISNLIYWASILFLFYFILFLCLLLKIHLTDLDILIKNQSKFLKYMGFKIQKIFIY